MIRLRKNRPHSNVTGKFQSSLCSFCFSVLQFPLVSPSRHHPKYTQCFFFYFKKERFDISYCIFLLLHISSSAFIFILYIYFIYLLLLFLLIIPEDTHHACLDIHRVLPPCYQWGINKVCYSFTLIIFFKYLHLQLYLSMLSQFSVINSNIQHAIPFFLLFSPIQYHKFQQN